EREELTQDERLPREPLSRLRYWVGEFAEDQNSSCVVYGADGRPLLRSERMPEESMPPVPVASEAPQSGSMTLPGIGRHPFRVYRLQFPGVEYTLLHLTPLAEVDRELRGVLIVLLAAVPVALVFCGGLGYLMARKALRPMDDLHRLTEQITADR